MEKKDFTLQLYKESVEVIINSLSQESNELYAHQAYSQSVGNSEERQKILEKLMIVEDLISQFVNIKIQIENAAQ